jgi:membrane protein DedA with SNARE-associated domain
MQMVKIFLCLVFLMLSATVCFLFGAFVSNVWDVTQWSQDGRFFCALGTLALTAVLTIYMEYK